ncbi:MAG: DUF362 domain-containing protein [Chloroflexi bacterium]|nr:DUF362 domain-containing protein [Chloroflexota bacterium]
MSHHPLSRRRFLGVAGASVAALLTPKLITLPGIRADGLTTKVHLHTFNPTETTTSDAVQAAMNAATDFAWLRPGDSVFVKVASNSNLTAPSVTSPAVLEGVIRRLKEAGAGTIYVGDMSGAQFVRHLAEGTIGSTRANMEQNGLLAAAEAAGAQVHCFEEVPFDQAYIPGVPAVDHHWGDGLQVAAILDQVDHIVNLPRLGKHVLAGASLGLKNAVGWISDHSRMVLHRDGATFHEKLAELNTIPQLAVKLRLTLTLADQALTTYGPDAGYRLPLTSPLIIASEDVVSHDQIALLALLWARQQTPGDALTQDPYPAQSNGLNWWFVRVTWGEEIAGYQELPTFDNLAAADTLTHINVAYDVLHGGRPQTIEVIPGSMPLHESLIALLTHNPDLHISVRG